MTASFPAYNLTYFECFEHWNYHNIRKAYDICFHQYLIGKLEFLIEHFERIETKIIQNFSKISILKIL